MRYLAILFIIIPSITLAYDEERATSNLASDYATCSAYYGLMAQGVAKSSKNTTTTENLLASSLKAFNIAVELSNDKVTASRVELSIKEMKDEMDNNWSNSAILINKYGAFCKELLENPEKRLLYWLNQKD